MQSLKMRLLACLLVTAMASVTPALAADRDDGPRGPVVGSPLHRFIRFVIHAFSDFSIPPG